MNELLLVDQLRKINKTKNKLILFIYLFCSFKCLLPRETCCTLQEVMKQEVTITVAWAAVRKIWVNRNMRPISHSYCEAC